MWDARCLLEINTYKKMEKEQYCEEEIVKLKQSSNVSVHPAKRSGMNIAHQGPMSDQKAKLLYLWLTQWLDLGYPRKMGSWAEKPCSRGKP